MKNWICLLFILLSFGVRAEEALNAADLARLNRAEFIQNDAEVQSEIMAVDSQIQADAFAKAKTKYGIDSEFFLALLKMTFATTKSEDPKIWAAQDWSDSTLLGYHPVQIITQKIRGFRLIRYETDTPNRPVVYAVAATKLYGSIRMIKDILGDMGFALPQLLSEGSIDTIRELTKGVPGRKIIVTGESLGGMLATGMTYMAVVRNITLDAKNADIYKDVASSPLRSIVFGTPGMRDAVKMAQPMVAERLHAKMDAHPEVADWPIFENYYYAVDKISRLGPEMGVNRELSADLLNLRPGENYCINIPHIGPIVEPHLGCGFRRAFEEGVSFTENPPRATERPPILMLRLTSSLAAGLLEVSGFMSRLVNGGSSDVSKQELN